MDTDRDGFVDEEELVSGIRHMFQPDERLGASGSSGNEVVPPAALFARMDCDQQERLYVSDIESFVMPQLRQILQLNNSKTGYSLTLSEMTGNVSLAIMRKIDIDKVGYLEE